MRTCVALVDATRARLFIYQPAHRGEREEFSERADLVNPARRSRPSELFSDSRPGSSRSGRLQFAFDDHRAKHLDAFDAEFARQIGHSLGELMRATDAKRLVLFASPHMLGALRGELRALPDGVAIQDSPRDLVKLSPTALRERLAHEGTLPPREREY